ncbi:hypothetical protein H4R35_007329, partial [Dimargaris xerosporica]
MSLKLAWLLVTCFWYFLAATFTQATNGMTDQPVRIRLVKGIQSGFAGPNTEEVVEIAGDLSQATITRHVFVSRWDTETYKGVIQGPDLENLLQNVENLAQLPRQPEPFENDAYGENVGLSVTIPDLTWSN